MQGYAKWLYRPLNQNVATAFHYVHGQGFIDDQRLALEAAAFIANVCLNLSEDHFDALVPPEHMSMIAAHIPIYKANRDRTFAFAVIASNLPEDIPATEVQSWIDIALQDSGLPSSSSIFSHALIDAASEPLPAGQSRLDIAEGYLLELGLEVLKARSTDIKFGVEASALPAITPPIFGLDGERLRLGGGAFDTARFDPEQMVHMELALDQHIASLSEWLR